jgi:hypothetical protein
MSMVILLAGAVVALGVLLLVSEIRNKHLSVWIGSYWRQQFRPKYVPRPGETTHILFCLVDHFEPLAGPSKAAERERLRAWLVEYPKLAGRHRDSDERPPQHSWFYPGEAYDEECLDALSQLARGGYGEIELHLHHGYDIPERLRARLEAAIKNFARHGALMTDEPVPRAAYGFIHGNMALNNSMHVGQCGVNNELRILKETGCYADFSMPTAPAPSQSRKINAVYYAADIPGRPKSHDDGVEVEVGKPPSGDLMIIPGPLGLNWHNRKWGLFPRIENAEIQGSDPPTPERIHCWARQRIHVVGRPNWIFVKVSCHGAEDHSREVLLGTAAERMYSFLEKQYRDRPGYRLHYVTARELYNIIKAAEAGLTGDPTDYRDYVIPRYRTHSALGTTRLHG